MANQVIPRLAELAPTILFMLLAFAVFTLISGMLFGYVRLGIISLRQIATLMGGFAAGLFTGWLLINPF